MNTSSNRIIVAVAGQDVEALMRFSLEEALRSGADLHLVHALHLPGSMLAETYAVAYAGARSFAVTLLEDAARVATELSGGRVVVTSELVERSTGAVRDLVSHSVGARAIVLQHRHLEGLHRFTTMSTTLGVAGRANVPVLAVPEQWPPLDPPFGRVTVGVSDPERADDVLRAAFEEAERRGAALRVVHSWWLANGYDAVVVGDDMRREFSERFRAEVAPRLEVLRASCPSVPVDVLVFHAQPAAGLMRAAEDSDVVVVGRRHWALPVGSHVGPVTRALLRSASCPVVVVEASREA